MFSRTKDFQFLTQAGQARYRLPLGAFKRGTPKNKGPEFGAWGQEPGRVPVDLEGRGQRLEEESHCAGCLVHVMEVHLNPAPRLMQTTTTKLLSMLLVLGWETFSFRVHLFPKAAMTNDWLIWSCKGPVPTLNLLRPHLSPTARQLFLLQHYFTGGSPESLSWSRCSLPS